MVYSFFLVGESLSEYAMFWMPGYRALKLGFIFWLAYPRFNVGRCYLKV